jgi:hypothetical protein
MVSSRSFYESFTFNKRCKLYVRDSGINYFKTFLDELKNQYQNYPNNHGIQF